MTRIGIILAVSGAFLASGCQDKAAIKALEESTGQLFETATQHNQQLGELSGEFDVCRTELARVMKRAGAAPADEPMFEIPSTPKKATVASLEAFKTALTDTIARQETRMTELKEAGATCVADLAVAKRPKKAVSKAAQKAQPEETSVKTQKAEEAGTPTKGVRSRYKTRTN